MKAIRIIFLLVSVITLFIFSSCKEDDPLIEVPVPNPRVESQKDSSEFGIYFKNYPYTTDQYIIAGKNENGYLFNFRNDSFCRWVTFDITNVTTGLTLFHYTWNNLNEGVGVSKQLYLIPGNEYVCTCNTTASGWWYGHILL